MLIPEAVGVDESAHGHRRRGVLAPSLHELQHFMARQRRINMQRTQEGTEIDVKPGDYYVI